MIKTRICKIFRFEAGHYLRNVAFTDEENYAIYGKCTRSHGHSYKLEVEVEGPVNEHGMVMNFHDLKNTVGEMLNHEFDHRSLNDLVITPTAENILDLLWTMLRKPSSLGEKLVRLRLWETETCYAEICAVDN